MGSGKRAKQKSLICIKINKNKCNCKSLIIYLQVFGQKCPGTVDEQDQSIDGRTNRVDEGVVVPTISATSPGLLLQCNDTVILYSYASVVRVCHGAYLLVSADRILLLAKFGRILLLISYRINLRRLFSKPIIASFPRIFCLYLFKSSYLPELCILQYPL